MLTTKCIKFFASCAALIAGLLLTTGAHADLIAADGGQVVYDAGANLSWLANADLAASNTFGVTGIQSDGSMIWITAERWIGAMNAANYLGYNDWRLPTSDTCNGYSCAGSEMGNLFYNELGGTAGNSILITHNADLSLFNNVQFFGFYWSGTETTNTFGTWNFVWGNGVQLEMDKLNSLFALAVRTGQVTAVPEPATYTIFLAGLVLMVFARRRKVVAA